MKILIILIITLQSFNLFSESVAPHDILIYKNKKYRIYNDILEIYFRKSYNTRPIIKGSCYSSKCEIATFEIKNNNLMLKKLIAKRFRVYKDKNGENKLKFVEIVVKKNIFKNKTKKITYYSGIIVLPHQIIFDGKGGYTYKNYTLLEITKGVLTKTKYLTANEFKQFQKILLTKFQKTKKYMKIASYMWDLGKSTEEINESIKNSLMYLSEGFLEKK